MPRTKQAAAPQFDIDEVVRGVVAKLTDQLGNGGTKLDDRLTEITTSLQDAKEEAIRSGAKLDEVGRVVGEIKPSISALGSRIQEVERNVGKPCPFHDLTVRQVEGVAGLQKQCAATELKLAELSQKHVGLTDLHTATVSRVSTDITTLQGSIGGLSDKVGSLTNAVTAMRDSGSDTKDWVKYIIISIMTVVFTMLTVKLVEWVSPSQYSPAHEKVEAVSSK